MKEVDVARPAKLYRYSTRKWLEWSLTLGEFRLRPASEYKNQEDDAARQDDELVRIEKSPAERVSIEIVGTGQKIKPIGEVVYTTSVGSDYLVVSFSKIWDIQLFERFPDTDACLVIHDVENFCERFHETVESSHPGLIGLDASVAYGGKSGLGAVFSKNLKYIEQQEYRFAWHSAQQAQNLNSVNVRLGDISAMAEIIDSPL